ncbi:MAG: PAS domain S-box protein [Bacteroidetes bacterium]|nr:PAS domain S-box protein [Bacteroidota bacterium]
MMNSENEFAAELTGSGIQTVEIKVLLLAERKTSFPMPGEGPQDRTIVLETKQVKTLDDFSKAIKRYRPDAIVLHHDIPRVSVVKALRYLKRNKLDIPVIAVIEDESEERDNPIAGEGKANYIVESEIKSLPELLVQLTRSGKYDRAAEEAVAGTISDSEFGEMFLEVVNEAGAGFIVAEASTKRPLYVNDAFVEITGYSADEILSLGSIEALLASEDADTLDKSLQAPPRKGPEMFNFAAKVAGKDGRMLRLEFSAKHFSWNNKRRIAMIVRDSGAPAIGTHGNGPVLSAGMSSEIPHTWKQTVEDAMDFAVFEIDEEGKIRKLSPGAERLMGYGYREILGALFESFMPEEAEARSGLVSFLRSSSAVERMELASWFCRKNRERFWARLIITRLFDALGTPCGFSVLLQHLSEKMTTEERLREREAQLQSLASHLQRAWEEEKTNIARQLHDEFGQMLTALRIDLSILGRMISRTVSEPLGRVSLLEKISSNSEILERAIRSTREMITELRPAVLDELGLLSAIQWQAVEFENRTGISCHVKKLQHGVSFDPAVSTATFRILQEALDNIMRHSGATEVWISLQVIEPNTVLEISDNGKGIDTIKLKDPSSTGIIGMRERVLALGGKLEVHGNPGRGTIITVSVPFPANQTI